jgi:hypothetical protein
MRERRRAPRPTRSARLPRRRRPRRRECARQRPSRRREASGSVSRGRSRRGPESAAGPPRAPAACQDRRHHLGRALARKSQLGHRRRALGIGEVRGPDETHPLERQLVVGRAGHAELVDLARPRAHVHRRAAERSPRRTPASIRLRSGRAGRRQARRGAGPAPPPRRAGRGARPTSGRRRMPSATRARRGRGGHPRHPSRPCRALPPPTAPSPRCWYHATSFSCASSSARSRR